MIKTRPRERNKPLFRTCKQSESVQSHAKTTLGVNIKIQSDIAVADANAVTSLGVNGPLVLLLHRYSIMLNIINRCTNTDTENIKLIVLAFISCNLVTLRGTCS